MATVFIPPAFRPYCGGREQVDVEGRTVRQVIERLEAEYPGIKSQIVVDDAIRPGLAIAVDEVLATGGLTQPVGPEATVHIVPAMAGG